MIQEVKRIVRTALLANSEIESAVGERIFSNYAGENPLYPHIYFEIDAGDLFNHTEGFSGRANIDIDVVAMGIGTDEAGTLADLVMTTLDSTNGASYLNIVVEKFFVKRFEDVFEYRIRNIIG